VHPLQNRPHTLYRFYDARGRLLYIGIAVDFLIRWRKHCKKDWWPQVARMEIKSYPSRSAVLIAERSAIIIEKPLHNELHNQLGRAEQALLAEQMPLGRLSAYWHRFDQAPWSEVGGLVRSLRVALLVFFNISVGGLSLIMGIALGSAIRPEMGLLAGLSLAAMGSLTVGEIAAHMCDVDIRRKKPKPPGYWRWRILRAVLFVR
jgi:hypothetical protein